MAVTKFSRILDDPQPVQFCNEAIRWTRNTPPAGVNQLNEVRLAPKNHNQKNSPRNMKRTQDTGDTFASNLFRGSKALAVAVVLCAPAATAFGQSFWSGGTGDYNNPGAWSGAYNSGNPNCCNDSGSANVVLIQPGDPVWFHGDTLAGQGGGASGSYLQTGSTNNTGYPNNGNWMRLGIGTGSTGYYTLSNGVVNVAGQTHLGENGTGTLEVDGGNYNTGFNGNPGLCVGDGDFGNGTVGTLIITGGTITNISNETWFGEANSGRIGTGHFIMHGGIITANNWFVFGRFGGQADGYMDGGTINKNNNGNWQMAVGNQGSTGAQVTFTQVGGTINCLSEYQIATDNPLAVCTNNIGGNAVLNVANWLAVGRNGGKGTLNISGNAAITKTGVNGGNVTLGGDNGGTPTGVINQTGGTFTNTATQTWIAENYLGTWNLSGGAAVLGVVHLTQNSSANGTFNLNGGDLTATEIADNGGTGTLNLNGGTLHAGAPANNPWIHNINGGVYLQAGGVTIDSAGNNVTISQVLADGGGGGLTKTGNGTLTLSGANNYTGPTVISAGTLATTTMSTGAGSYTVGNGTVLGLQVAGSLNSQLNASSVTFASPATTLNVDLNAFGNPVAAPLNVTGTLAVNGTVTVNILDSAPATGQFPLIQYTPGNETGSGSFVLGSLPSGELAYLSNNVANNSIDLVVTRALGAPRWNGNVTGGVWDINTTANWIDIATALPTTYQNGANVLLDDNASGTTTVNLTVAVTPGSVTVNNSSLPYTLVGAGSINGTIGLLKEGSSTLAILNNNGYTGPTVISGGTLSVTNLVNGGSASPIGASSASPTNLVINNAVFSYGGAPVAVNRGFTVANTNSTIDAESNLTLSGAVAVATNTFQGDSFVKVGPAQLALTASGRNEFSYNYEAGIDVQAGTLLLDGSAGNQTNHTQNQLWVGSTPVSGASLILSNTTLKVDDWIGLGRINGGINNTSTITLYNSAATIGNLSLGWDGGLGGNLSSQFLTLNGNSTLTNFGSVNLAEGANSSMTLSVNDNSVFWVQNPFYLCLAAYTTGSAVVAGSGMIVENNGWFDIAQGVNSVGSLLLENNASLWAQGDFNLTDTGAGATASVTVQDNATLHANNLFVGKSPNSIATFTITNNATVLSSNGLTMATYFNGAPEVSTATVNLSGGSLAVNLVQGNNVSGTYYGIFNFNGGRLIARNPFATYFMFNLAAINVLTGGAVIDTATNTIAIAQPLLDGDGNGGGLTKLGNGTLLLDGVNTYTGTTTVTSGTLGGSGTIAGPVVVSAGATLAPGDSAIGTLTLAGTLNLAGTSQTVMEVNKTANTSDLVTGASAITYGGTLVLKNLSGALQVGDTFTLFAAGSYSGSFSSVVSQTPNQTVTWDVSQLAPGGNGTVKVATAVAAPVVLSPVVSGGNINLSWPANQIGWELQQQSNPLTVGLSTNWVAVPGSTATNQVSLPAGAGAGSLFFRLVFPQQ
jgi:autotransporter-associated beta strand protein